MGIKTEVKHHMPSVQLVQMDWETEETREKRQCTLQFPWYGGGRRIILHCYCYRASVTGFSAKNKHKIVNLSLDSTLQPVLHNKADLLISLPLKGSIRSSNNEEECGEGAAADVEEMGADAHFILDDKNEPQKFSQGELNNLVRDLELSKAKANLLASCLRENCLLKQDICITHFRKRNETTFLLFSGRATLFLQQH